MGLIFLSKITFFDKIGKASVFNGLFVWDNCLFIGSSEDYIIKAKGIWIAFVVHLDFACAVGSFLTPFHATISGI